MRKLLLYLLRKIVLKNDTPVEYTINRRRVVLPKIGDEVKKGDILTDGSISLNELFKNAGKDATQQYILREVSKVYEFQGRNPFIQTS